MKLNYHKIQGAVRATLHQPPLPVCCVTNFLLFIILQNVLLTCVGIYSSPKWIRGMWDTSLSRDGNLALNKNLAFTILFQLYKLF